MSARFTWCHLLFLLFSTPALIRHFRPCLNPACFIWLTGLDLSLNAAGFPKVIRCTRCWHYFPVIPVSFTDMILFKTLWLDDYVESKSGASTERQPLQWHAWSKSCCLILWLKEPEDELSILNIQNEKPVFFSAVACTWTCIQTQKCVCKRSNSVVWPS